MENNRQAIAGHHYTYLILSIFVIIPLFRPRSITQFGTMISRLFYLGQILFSLVVFVYIIYGTLIRKKRAIGSISWICIAYKTWETISIFKNGLGEISTIVYAAVFIGAIVLSEWLSKEAPLEFLSFLSLYTGLLVIMNNISFLMGGFAGFADATGNIIYFWQTKNHLSSLFFIALISAYLINGMKHSKVTLLWNLIVFLNIVWGTLNFQSATTIVGVVSYIFFYYLFKRKTALYRPVLFYIAGLGLHIAIVILRVQDFFAYIIEHFLHRSLTMSGRTMIWDAAINSILRNPFVGYGQSSIFTFSFAKEPIPAHNQFLDISVVCGIVGLVAYLVLFLIGFIKLAKNKDSMVARIICCSLLAYVIMSITESPSPYHPWFILLGMIGAIPEMDKQYINISYRLTNSGKLICTKHKGNRIL